MSCTDNLTQEQRDDFAALLTEANWQHMKHSAGVMKMCPRCYLHFATVALLQAVKTSVHGHIPDMTLIEAAMEAISSVFGGEFQIADISEEEKETKH